MLRLIGILTGAALAIGLLVVAVGLPVFTPPEPAVNNELVTLPAAPDIPVATEAPEPAAAFEPAAEPAPEPDPELEAVIEDLFAHRDPVEQNWYAFWSPFRSEIAANGFVAKLQEKTGIDYRVVKVKTGVYEVAFAYSDDADVTAKLQQISTATGLEMSGI